MNFKHIILSLLCIVIALPTFADDSSDKSRPRWMTSSLPTPKSQGYIFVKATGSGSSLEEARQMAIVNLSAHIEHERGISVSSTVRIEKTGTRGGSPTKNQNFVLEASEHGKQIDITCKIVDEYWDR
ncbi:MAG: hypothetical protein K2K05_12130 [Muribaculaceae bacterium]|nr:hypothetical protein [Muribaculaceae bacterium]